MVSVREYVAPRRISPVGAAKLSAGTQTESKLKCSEVEKELAERDRQIEVLRGLSKALEAQAKGLKKDLEKAREQGALAAPRGCGEAEEGEGRARPRSGCSSGPTMASWRSK